MRSESIVAVIWLSCMSACLAADVAPGGAVASADNPLGLRSDHVTVSVADIDKEATWYEHVLGFTEFARSGDEKDGFLHRQLRILGVYRIDLSWRRGSVRHTVGAPSDLEQGWRHIVFTAPDLESVLQTLRAKHIEVRVDRDKQDQKITQLFIVDPEGNEIEIQSRV